MQRLKRMIYNMPIRNRFMAFFIIVAMVIIVVMLTFSLNILISNIENNMYDSLSIMMDQACNAVNNTLQSTERMSHVIARSGEIQELLMLPEGEVDNDSFLSENVEDFLLYQTNTISHYIPSSYVIGNNGVELAFPYITLYDKDFREEEWYKNAIATTNNGYMYSDTGKGSNLSADEKGHCFQVCYPIIENHSGKRLGVVAVDIHYEMIFNEIKGHSLNLPSSTLYFDQDGEPILLKNATNLPPKVRTYANEARGKKAGGEIIRRDGKGYFVYHSSFSNKWTVVNVIEIDQLLTESNVIIQYTIVIAIVITVLGVLLAWWLANTISKPILHLRKLMYTAENGDLTVSMDVQYEDEVGQLGRSFNHMIGRIRSLVDTVTNDQRRLRKAQLQIYQEQINPHFLYNTMDSIQWLTRMGNNEQAVVMINALTKLLRIGLSKGRTMVTIEDEVEHATNYLIIQKIRYSSRLQYSIALPDELKKLYTPKLILQPIVENAIYHGLKNKREIGQIDITVEQKGDNIVFTVQDTGIGISEEKLHSIRELLQRPAEKRMEKDGFGLRNVNDRVRIMFGPDYGLSIQSEFEKGTIVVITIPVLRENTEDA